MTTSLRDAEAIFASADRHDVAVTSSSAWRFSAPLQAALADESLGAIVGIDLFGAMLLEPALPGLFWYGIHLVEMTVAALGVGCRRARALSNASSDAIGLEWEDSRMATLRGLRDAHERFGVTLHRKSGFQTIDFRPDDRPRHVGLLEAVVSSFPRVSAAPREQTLEVIRIIELANAARMSVAP